MDGSEDPLLLEELERLERVNRELIDLAADACLFRIGVEGIIAKAWREKAALQASNDRLRDELRRYTAAKLV